MDDPGRIELRHWANFDQNHLRDYFREHPALKLMDVLAERDAAFAERDTAIAEKKTAYAERDAALLQRDVAFADRNSAWMERDSAMAALTVVRGRKDHNEGNGRLMQMVNFAVSCPPMESNLLTYPRPANVYENFIEAKPLATKQMKQQGKKTTDSPKKRKSSAMNDHDTKPPRSSPKKKRNKKAQPETSMRMDIMNQVDFLDNRHVAAAAPYDISSTPIPYCSCTGASQQCYRWGKGGWQSACCTKYTSMYPLPMNPAKRGSRIAGRKMSGGAFKKLLERLLGEGVDIREPIDLKDHWAKHGTNKYVTIK